jgi:hypothetical protein
MMVYGATSNDSTEQLSLALFARQALEALLEFVEEGKRENLDSTLREAADSIDAATNRISASQALTYPRAFRSYAQALTLQEVLPKDRRQELTTNLRALLDRTATGPREQQQAEEAITFFLALENRALRNFTRSTRNQATA